MARGLKRVALYTLLGVIAFAVLLFVVSAAIGYTVAHRSAQGAQTDLDGILFWLVAGIAVACMAGAQAITIGWMRAIDEAAREAHKSAWFWGGCGGMAV